MLYNEQICNMSPTVLTWFYVEKWVFLPLLSIRVFFFFFFFSFNFMTNYLLRNPSSFSFPFFVVVPFWVCSTSIFFLINDRLHVALVFIWVHKLFAIPTHLFSTHVIFGLPLLVRHDFVAFHTFVKFLTHRLAFSVGSTVVCKALISSEYFVACTTFSPSCFLRDTNTTLCFSFSFSLFCSPDVLQNSS